MGDTPAITSSRDEIAGTVQEILSGMPGDGTWLLPVVDAHDTVVDFRIAATGEQGRDLYARGAARRDARLSELYASMVGGPLWQMYLRVLATGDPEHLPDFRYEDSTGGVAAESHFDVTVHPAFGGLLVGWRRVDEDRRRMGRIEQLGRLGWAEYDLRTGTSEWSAGMYSIFERDPALGPLSQAAQAAARLSEDRGVSETAWQTLDSGGGSDVTVRFRIGDTVKHLRILSDVSRDADGAPLKIYAVVQDVTSREDTRTEIDLLRDQLRTREMTALAEHRLAGQLQNLIQPIPDGPLRLPGLEATVAYLPAESATQVGGDWFHTQALPDGHVILAVGDVAGHGLDAAGGMAHLRYALTAWLSIGIRDPAQLVGHLNHMCTELRITATVVLAVYDPASGQMRWSRAGHMSPLLGRQGTASSLPAPAGLLLGAEPDATYVVAVSQLNAGDLVLFYTDGLVERRDGEDRVELVQQALRSASVTADNRDIVRLSDILNEPSPHDDTCTLLVRVLA